MKKSLPGRPHLEHLRTQAKQLLSDLRAGKAAAIKTLIEYLPAAKMMTAGQVRRAGFRLADAQSAIARQSGFAAWPHLARHVEQLRALEGEWEFDSLEVDGRAMPTVMLGRSRLLMDGDRFRMQSPDADYDGIFTLDVEANPERIDIEFVEGPEAGNWSYGIFRLNGDALLLCLGLVGASRPTRFATRAGSGHALERLHRFSSTRPADVGGGRRDVSVAPPSPVSEAIDEGAFALKMTPLLEQLQGEWLPVRLIAEGVPLDDAMLAFGSRTLIDNETKVVFGGQTMVHARIRIDEAQVPVAVDYLNIGGSGRLVTLGILEQGSGIVRFCTGPAKGPRPTEFSSEKGSGRILSEWKRK